MSGEPVRYDARSDRDARKLIRWPSRSPQTRRTKSILDTTLIPPREQYGATLSNAGKGNPSKYAAFAIPCTPLQHLSDHS